jgi:PAS domain-containing protein
LCFTEAVTAKLHGLPDEAAIYRTVVQEFSRSNRYDVTILFLTDDGTALRLAQTSLSPERAQALAGIVRQAQTPPSLSPEHEQAPTSAAGTAGTPLAVHAVCLDGSLMYQQVVRGGWTLHARGREVLSDLLPPPLPDLITERLGYAQSWFALTPLRRRGRIVGILAASHDDETQLWADAIRLLSRHISGALDRIDGEARRLALDEELRRTVERFRALLERTSDCIVVLGRDGIVGYASPSSERLLGCEHEWCIGKTSWHSCAPRTCRASVLLPPRCWSIRRRPFLGRSAFCTKTGRSASVRSRPPTSSMIPQWVASS